VRLQVFLREEDRLREFVNKIVRTAAGPETEEVRGGWKNSRTKTARCVCLTRY
jgi:hypothetical protein